MNNIFIDLGNTNLKIKIETENNILDSEVKYFSSKKITSEASLLDFLFQNFSKDVFDNIKWDYLIYSSVKPEKDEIINNSFKQYLDPSRIIKFQNSIQNIIQTPFLKDKNAIGSDIVANAIFANTLAPKNIIISLGTASVITKNNNQTIEGAIISTGLEISRKALLSNASRLANLELIPTDKTIGQNTLESLYIGIYKGHYKMIKGLVEEINETEYKIIYTGGNFNKLKNFIENDNFIYIENMVIEGLKIFLKEEILKNGVAIQYG